MDHFVGTFERKTKVTIEGKEAARTLSRLEHACEKAKSSLSSGAQANISLDSLFDGKDLYDSVSRARFEALCASSFSKCLAPLKSALEQSGVAKDQLDQVLLVGGCTRMPKIKDTLKSFLGDVPVIDTFNPSEVIASGATIQSGLLAPHHASAELNKTPTVAMTTLSLSIGVVGGLAYPIVPRGTALPCTTMLPTSTSEDNQTSVSITVCQGERLKVGDNDIVGRFVLSGIAAAPRGTAKVAVKFSLDKEGVLTVTATDESSKTSSALTVQRSATASDSSAAVAEAAKKEGLDKLYFSQVSALRDLAQLVQDTIAAPTTKADVKAGCAKIASWVAVALAKDSVPALPSIMAKRSEFDALVKVAVVEDDSDDEDDEEDEEESSDGSDMD
jgi:L1 cell adhesion molecule like protein